MSIKSIKIKNLLSFDDMELANFEEINCIVGKNNVGKSNFLTLVRFFYDKIEGKRELAPELNSNYSSFGEITIEYNLTRMKKIVMSGVRNSKFFNVIYSSLIKNENVSFGDIFLGKFKGEDATFKLTLRIAANGASEWLENDSKKVALIGYLYPFFYIDSRHIDLHDWDKLWSLLAKIKSFNIEKIDMNEYYKFMDSSLSDGGRPYSDYIKLIEDSVTIEKYSHRDKVLSFIKSGVKGDVFNSDGVNTKYQSDGTNSFHYIDSTLKLLMLVTRKEYITPFVFIDEPEVGLHPKKCEILINNLYATHMKYGYNGKVKYKTPFPQVLFSTHSPSIVKEVIRNFQSNHQVIQFSKSLVGNTLTKKMNSKYTTNNFLSIFSDNEARLFFSDFILFVEGETELELFGNFMLQNKYPVLKGIDIYQCGNNKIAEGINPSFSNTSIPYLFLYDADKFYEFDVIPSNQKVKVKMQDATKLVGIKPERLEKEVIYYKRGRSEEHKRNYDLVSRLYSFVDKDFETDDTGFFFKNNSPLYVLRDSAKKYLKNKNVIMLNDTIEGSLICDESKEIFFDWLKNNYNVDVNDLRNSNMNIGSGSNTILLDDKLLVTCIRIMFDGKPETQFKKSRNYKNIKDTMHSLKGKKYWPTITKTCGWVTSFIDYAIEHIELELEENKSGDTTFYSLFSGYFPELHGILNRLYPDRP